MNKNPPPAHRDKDVEGAIAALLQEHAQNQWFVHTYWPENEARVRMMLADVLHGFPTAAKLRVLDVGCFNGFVSYLLAHLGCSVVATDAGESTARQTLFQRQGIEFFISNLNEPELLGALAPQSFDVVILGEVIEHILNHPLGLVQQLGRVLHQDGLLILTTPNPSTLMNAVRLLRGRTLLWGTAEFMEMPKFDGRRMISYEGIHYREYTTAELRHLLSSAGFRVMAIRYLGMGASSSQSLAKIWLKKNPLTRKLMSLRPFGCTHYVLARKQNGDGGHLA